MILSHFHLVNMNESPIGMAAGRIGRSGTVPHGRPAGNNHFMHGSHIPDTIQRGLFDTRAYLTPRLLVSYLCLI